MPARITLTPVAGPLKGQGFAFTRRTFCAIGRSSSCLLRLGDSSVRTVSRRHCLLDIEPPLVRVFDLGSRNGTYVNGRSVGRRAQGASPAEPLAASVLGVELRDGDRLAMGDSEFVIGIEDGAPPAAR